MVEIKNLKLLKYGGSTIIRIPAQYLKHSNIDSKKKYDVILSEVIE